MALVYDFVPEEYQPSSIAYSSFVYVRDAMRDEAQQPTTMGHIAASIHEQMVSTENYFKTAGARFKAREETAKRCNENALFRYIMYIGDEDNPNCSEQNMRLKAAIGEIDHPNAQPADQTQTNTATPAATQPLPTAFPTTPLPQAAPAPAQQTAPTTQGTMPVTTPQPTPAPATTSATPASAPATN